MKSVTWFCYDISNFSYTKLWLSLFIRDFITYMPSYLTVINGFQLHTAKCVFVCRCWVCTIATTLWRPYCFRSPWRWVVAVLTPFSAALTNYFGFLGKIRESKLDILSFLSFSHYFFNLYRVMSRLQANWCLVVIIMPGDVSARECNKRMQIANKYVNTISAVFFLNFFITVFCASYNASLILNWSCLKDTCWYSRWPAV